MLGVKLGFLAHVELAPPDPAARAGKDGATPDVEASAGESRLGPGNDSDGGGRAVDGWCWMVCILCPVSMEG